MPNGLQSLSMLYNNRIFRIPDYQRGYAWQHAQLTDFWEDLLNLQDDRYHYTGLLSLKEARTFSKDLHWPDCEWLFKLGYKPYHVVDGQQRLTTIAILMNAMAAHLHQLPENKGKPDTDIFLGDESLLHIKEKYLLLKRPKNDHVTAYLFGYETDTPSHDYLKHKVFDEPFGGAVFESFYTKNLKYAKAFFSDNLERLCDSEGLGSLRLLYEKLTQRLMFNLHEIEDDYDVFVAFETMNNRGKKLTNLELLKNRLIYLSTLFPDMDLDDEAKSSLRKKIDDTWKEVYFQLGRNQNSPLSDDEYLRAHWILFFQYTRTRGDDYIHFLLSKFSAKRIFDKFSYAVSPGMTDSSLGMDSIDESDDDSDDLDNLIQAPPSVPNEKLTPKDITEYINSLKENAQNWYYSHFPGEDTELPVNEKVWIDKLNRIGIVYFRPLVVAALTRRDITTTEDRIALYQAIERFIFVSFRMAGFNASYRSSEINNQARRFLYKEITITEISQSINCVVDGDLPAAIASFITRTDRRFDSGVGFYGWRDIRYFLYEYEYERSISAKIQKVDWNLFTNAEKDKVTIEHILPQTPTKWYWRNQYRSFTVEEIKVLSGSLGNLVPLSQSINSSMQNDSFYDKKQSSYKGRRGYSDGSHSEIEVSKQTDWNAQCILERGRKLLHFMEHRWRLQFTDEQVMRLLHIDFVNDGRETVPEIPEEPDQQIGGDPMPTSDETVKGSRQDYRLAFWMGFTEYCRSHGRGEDIGSHKPSSDNWYDVSIGNPEYFLFFQVMQSDIMRIGIYIHRSDAFARLSQKRDALENAYGDHLDWDSSYQKSVAKRVLHSIKAEVRNAALYPQYYAWLIRQYDRMKAVLENVDDGRGTEPVIQCKNI